MTSDFRRDLPILLRGELRWLLRDPMALVLMIAGPILLYPLLLAGALDAKERNEETADTRELTVAAAPELDPWIEPDQHLRRVAPDQDADVAVRFSDDEAVITHRGNERWSDEAANRVEVSLDRRADALVAETWRSLGVRETPDGVLKRVHTDRASTEDQAGATTGKALPPLLIFLLLGGALYTALELVSGEKERGTIETLLTTRVHPRAVITAKALVVWLVTLVTGVISLVAIGSATVIQGGWDAAPGVGAAAWSFALLIPLSATLSGVVVAAAAWARDFRTGQAMSLPIMAACAAPAGLAALEQLQPGGAMALVPIGGIALALRDALSSQLSAGVAAWTFIAATLHAAVALWAADRFSNLEYVMVGGSKARRKQVGNHVQEALSIYVVGIVLFWFFGQFAMSRALLPGVLFTQVVLIGGLGVAGVAWVGLPLKETLQLRAPHPIDVALAIAAGFALPFTADLVHSLQQPLLPTPTSFAEQFSAGLGLDEQPLYVLILFFALLPAICEELLYRGALQGLLRGGLRLWPRVLLIGAMFGFIHLALPRILPTAALGVVFALVAARTRSLWPSMLMHLLNNGIILTVAYLGLGDDEGSPLALQLAGLAVVILTLSAMGRSHKTAE